MNTLAESFNYQHDDCDNASDTIYREVFSIRAQRAALRGWTDPREHPTTEYYLYWSAPSTGRSDAAEHGASNPTSRTADALDMMMSPIFAVEMFGLGGCTVVLTEPVFSAFDFVVEAFGGTSQYEPGDMAEAWWDATQDEWSHAKHAWGVGDDH